MENLAVITALNHEGSFGKYFVKFKRKRKCYSAAKVGLYWEKLWTLSSIQVLKTLGIHTSVCYV